MEQPIELQKVLDHIVSKGCVPGENNECYEGTGWLYKNLNNFKQSFVMNEPLIDPIAYCAIITELGIEPIPGTENAIEKFIQMEKSRKNASKK